MKLFKSITFKLTFWYGLIFFVSSIFLLFSINFAYSKFVNRTLEEVLPPRLRQQLTEIERGGNGNHRLRELVMEVRQNDLKQVQRVSFGLIFLNILVAATGGYILAKQMLRPIQKLNTEMAEINESNLNRKIVVPDTKDEITEIIDNFNKMTDRLYKAFQAQGEFVANSAHELKTPLAILTTNLEASTIIDSVNNDTKEYITNSINTISEMNLLIEDLLLLSSINKNSFEFEKIALDQLIQQVADNLQNIAEEKKIHIKTNIRTKDCTIEGQKHLLERALSNIIENAIKYSPAKSTVEVSVDSWEKGNTIIVKDHGPGIPAKYRDKIFDRFFRVDSSRSKKTGGSGLGLAIVKEIVELHNGSISLKNNSPKGAEFEIKLPSNQK